METTTTKSVSCNSGFEWRNSGFWTPKFKPVTKDIPVFEFRILNPVIPVFESRNSGYEHRLLNPVIRVFESRHSVVWIPSFRFVNPVIQVFDSLFLIQTRNSGFWIPELHCYIFRNSGFWIPQFRFLNLVIPVFESRRSRSWIPWWTESMFICSMNQYGHAHNDHFI